MGIMTQATKMGRKGHKRLFASTSPLLVISYFGFILTLALISHSSWSLHLAGMQPDLKSHYDTVSPFIFDSVHGLLKQWPNTFSPNGHSIVVGTVTPHTLLYHANYGGPAKKPTYFAFDALVTRIALPSVTDNTM